MGYENPLLALPAARKVLALPADQRGPLEALMRELRAEANTLAEESWRRRKSPMAVYWRAVSTYARHIAHALSKGQSSSERPSQIESPAASESLSPAAREALAAAAKAIYFNDSSDYERALWTVVRSLAPELRQVLENNPRAAFDDDMELILERGADSEERGYCNSAHQQARISHEA
jgi:hypothetical protein